MTKHLFLFLAALLYSCNAIASPDGENRYQAFSSDGVPFVVADTAWDVNNVGNHRAVVEVSGKADAVRVVLPWRRADLLPESKRIMVKDTIGNDVANVDADTLTTFGRCACLGKIV